MVMMIKMMVLLMMALLIDRGYIYPGLIGWDIWSTVICPFRLVDDVASHVRLFKSARYKYKCPLKVQLQITMHMCQVSKWTNSSSMISPMSSEGRRGKASRSRNHLLWFWGLALQSSLLSEQNNSSWKTSPGKILFRLVWRGRSVAIKSVLTQRLRHNIFK